MNDRHEFSRLRLPGSARRIYSSLLWSVVCFSLAAGLSTGCGYTVMQKSGADDAPPHGAHAARPGPGSETQRPEAMPGNDLLLPPDHPRILAPEEWVGRSFLDDLLGEDDPLRFENLRRHPHAGAPTHHAIVTFRITVGGPAVADVWQVRMDEFGWVTVTYWMQGAAGPVLDESLATRRAEFRLARESEAALRAMIIELLPQSLDAPRLARPEALRDLPIEYWPHGDPGVLEIEYRIETLGRADPEDWPGGRVSAPLDLMQLLIRTWENAPPLWLRRAVRDLAAHRPSLVSMAMVTEAITLAWEVEGYNDEAVELPLQVGR
ncbi:MAG: hypothetical protein KAY32_02325 [Candidatus Eisenbacteria sp.]|nr:hypothetical protein [Candidatus Eisenbacteria bacterium]